jgi:hypothetical protein
MEQDIEQTFINSDYFDKQAFQKQIDIIKQASEEAQTKIDYTTAHDDNIIRAIEVVETFLRKKHRLCYGGQAINAHLPAKYRFYDPEYMIPDYDFFSPQQSKDINILIRDLQKAGFIEVSAREGMHEGTIKIYVDYIPVADITAIDTKLYRILSKREFRFDGISYLDANTLRMMMYLELSRPRGQVSRWPKVFERLALFNEFVPVKSCQVNNPFKGRSVILDSSSVNYIINYIVSNSRIFAGADLLDFYNTTLKTRKLSTSWIFSSKKPIIFFSQNGEQDAKVLHSELKKNEPEYNVTIKIFSSGGVELIPYLHIILVNNYPVIIIVKQTACHSYYNIPLKSHMRKILGHNQVIRIASIDTLITLYFSLGLLDTAFFDMGSIECVANKLVEISLRVRKNPETFPLPFISLKCAGHQTTISSLIRAKVQRITRRRINNKKNTIKNTNKNTNKK